MDGLFTGLQNARGAEPARRRQASRLNRVTTAQLLSSLDQQGMTGPHPARVTPREQPWLADALGELAECVDEAREEGYPKPTAEALAIAEVLLKRITLLATRSPQPSVYPSADNEIVLFFCRGEVQAAVSMSIEADGGGVCFSNVGGLRRARYQDARELPDAFVAGELLKLSHLVASPRPPAATLGRG